MITGESLQKSSLEGFLGRSRFFYQGLKVIDGNSIFTEHLV